VYQSRSRGRPASEPLPLRLGTKAPSRCQSYALADYDRLFALLVTAEKSYSRISILLGRDRQREYEALAQSSCSIFAGTVPRLRYVLPTRTDGAASPLPGSVCDRDRLLYGIWGFLSGHFRRNLWPDSSNLSVKSVAIRAASIAPRAAGPHEAWSV